ncbi:MAG TPA: SDR family oxidoreductase [Abditibacteriaceae bacterium]|jgi:NAD(P)-dependent dehydrogenase (short-subunit alcohol dehydrogenase family)
MNEFQMTTAFPQPFDLTGRVAVITGGGGLMGAHHAAALAEAGAIPVLLDISGERAAQVAGEIAGAWSLETDITQPQSVETALAEVLRKQGRIDILINNAANNPKMESSDTAWSRMENFPLQQWDDDIAVGLTGAFLCCQVFGAEMARRGGGVILNIASDLAVIAPDQRLYRQPDLPENEQPVKPVTYSVVKTALIGLTRYLATYWADRGVRVNAISPGGIENNQPEEFRHRLENLIPMSRMARPNEYEAAILFLCSDASAYMTGQNLIMDGGRSCW